MEELSKRAASQKAKKAKKAKIGLFKKSDTPSVVIFHEGGVTAYEVNNGWEIHLMIGECFVGFFRCRAPPFATQWSPELTLWQSFLFISSPLPSMCIYLFTEKSYNIFHFFSIFSFHFSLFIESFE